ncbi:acyl--CoA ligase [Sphingomonas sp. MG17]|uniref:Acyl--CoA ligase n=1 Tax=Sphingomonas tagetis TaxID=2949092 RepID=A0A9X2HMY3_9SPHN|nr:class I adenylate-forming enzyme family protein [Sphingomonas tagetis]MCP3732239.1 acyl--CoA ligase [Sphingomonas tagetis]
MNTTSRLELAESEFITLPDLLHVRATEQPDKLAFIDARRETSYEALDRRMSRVAGSLQRDGLRKGDHVAICASGNSIEYIEAFFGALRLGVVVAPLAPSGTPDSLRAQIKDSSARVLFLDADTAEHLGDALFETAVARVALDGSSIGIPFETWLNDADAANLPAIVAEDPFNLIYSSGTTGAPKGIVQPHAMRWGHMRRAIYPPDAVTLISTPLYSNTTLVSLIPTIANGGTVVLMKKFDAAEFLSLSERHRATHAMLVPVQYRRILDHPSFATRDLSSYRLKFATSAPFDPALKREVIDRWPGGLIEFYGMTEGGGTCVLLAHAHPDKLHSVGQPLPDHDIRTIDEEGRTTKPGVPGEVVGRSAAMMTGYHNLPGKTSEAEWYSPDGKRFIRTGDLGMFDPEGFLVLIGRKKDMIISGGFNIYPGDLEAVLLADPTVAEAAVVGIPSASWGETPVGFVTLREGADADDTLVEDIRAAANAKLGKTQRLSDLRIVPELPRSAIGKILKRELRDMYVASTGSAGRTSIEETK